MERAIAHDIENGMQRTSDVAAGSISFQQISLGRNILKCLQAHKFLTPTKIQAAAIPMALAGMDLLVQSKSGTGKTLIYVLAAMEMMDTKVAKPQALIIVPTRELAIQVEDTVNGLANNRKDYLTVSFIGGTDVKKDRVRMAKGRIVVGTPGRLLHLMHNNVFNMSAIKLLVLDEADQLCGTDTLQKDVQSLISALPPLRQIIACSATYPNALDERLAEVMNRPVLVSNSERATVLLGIRQFVYELPEQPNNLLEMLAKLAAVQKIFGQLPYEQTILFASSQSRADSFCNYLRRADIECDLMSGAMNQSDRLETFEAYRNFETRILVATDLMARGVDSSHANLIINLDLPNDLVSYLHRIGRAGRFGSKGIAITFICSQQQREKFKCITADAGTGMSVLQFPTEKVEGFDFWNYDAYDFPYFHKMEAYEQEESELKSIRQHWKPTGTNKQLQHPVEIAKEHLRNEDLDGSITQKRTKHLELHDNSDELDIDNIVEVSLQALQRMLDTDINSQIESAPENTVKYAKQGLETKAKVSQEIELKVNDTEKNQEKYLKPSEHKKEISNDNQTQKQKSNNTKNVLKPGTKAYMKPRELQQSAIEIIELTPSSEIPAAAPNSINTRTYCMVAPMERSSTTLHPLGISNTVDDASSIVSDSMENDYDSDASYSSCYSESDAQLIWHCALLKRKLHKRYQRNAGRHIFNFNWRQCNKTLVKVKRRANEIKDCLNKSGVEKQKQSEEWEDLPNKDEQLLGMKRKSLEQRKKLFLEMKINNKEQREKQPEPNINSRLLSISKKLKCFRLLQKFNNMQQLQERLAAKLEEHNSDQWLINLYDVMQHLYYADHSKPKQLHKRICPDISNLHNYNRLMELIWGTPYPKPDEKHANEQQPQTLNKLSVHVNQQMNILPSIAVAGNDEAEDNYSSNSESSYVPEGGLQEDNNEVSDVDSVESYSSSGFVESAESASSGIDTSQYDSRSSVFIESEDYDDEEESSFEEEDVDEDEDEDEDDELQSNESQSVISFTLTADADDDETDSESETEDQKDDDSASDTSAGNDDAAKLALAQARWQYLFQMQYQFVANFVDNYMATCRRQP